MEFLIDLGVLNSVFVVPTSVVDKHIKLVGSAQIKVLLWMLRHAGNNFSKEDISRDLSMSVIDVSDAMNYWLETEIIFDKAKNRVELDLKSENNTNTKQDCSSQKIRRLMSRPQKPNSESVAKRIQEDDKIAFLMEEAQIILGRTISNGDSALLLMIHDNDGLPVSVITMLLQYAVSIGKNNMKYIEKMGISWGFEEIDTIEKADKKIRTLHSIKNAWKCVQGIIGVDRRSPTPKEEEATNRWINDWKLKEELIKEAYNRCVDAKGKYILGYMDTILKRWRTQGIDSLEKANLEKAEFSKTSVIKKRKPSYDIKKYKSFSVFD
ncbi:MAG: DnaD domain protein [Oscillospiraceae bacterium]|jgi:DnaD/phage-associated family protein|nr:DnaD domain protein [Oscillospiraceae bacterium]